MNKQFVKMSSRSSRNTLKLNKPAPRKVSINCGETIKHTERELTCAGDGLPINKEIPKVHSNELLTEKMEKSNIINKRVSRGLKLEKPAPLKASTSKRIEDSTSVTTSDESILSKDNFQMSLNLAKATASRLVLSTLSDLEMQNTSPQMNSEPKEKPCLMSQMSHDSGVEDMLSYSRQSSAFDSLSESVEYQDDLDWENIDDKPVETFILGCDKMQHTSYGINQAFSFNKLLVDNQSSNYTRTKCHGSKTNHRMSFNEEIRLDGVDETAELEVSDSANVRYRRQSDPSAKMNVNIDRQRHQSFDGSYSALKRLNSAVNFKCGDLSGPISNGQYNTDVNSATEVWEEDLIEVPRQEEGLETKVKKKRQAVISENSLSGPEECDDFKGCDEEFSDIENTPKANERLFKFTDQRVQTVELELKQKHAVLHEDLSDPSIYDENANVKLSDKDKSVETMSEIITRLSESLEYRDTDEFDLNSSYTKSSTDGLSESTPDEGFNEQEYVWELIDDLSVGVQSLKLENNNDDNDVTLKKCLPPQFSLHEFSILPDNFAEIEAELDGLGEEMDKLHKSKEEFSEKVASSKKLDLKKIVGPPVFKIREPLSPYSTQEEIWAVEEGLPCGMYTAKGRRLMFKNFRLCQMEEKEKECQNHLIQYTAGDLLELGTSPLSRQEPDSWSYLTVIFPEICLKGISEYFDSATYSITRGYVVANHNVEDRMKNSKSYRQNSGNNYKAFHSIIGQ